MADLFRESTVLITGASSGLGAAFAALLAERGAHLVLTARDADRLDAVAARARSAGVSARVFPADLSLPGASERLVEALDREGLVVDHLINNAGFSVHGLGAQVPVEDQLAVLDLNARAATDLALRLLPGMVARGRGGILNVGSLAGFQGLARLSVYAASKAYLLTWSEALWVELRGTGVRCCCLCPGPIDTPYFDTNRTSARPSKRLMQSADAVARAGLRAYSRDASHAMSGILPRLTAWATRVLPRAMNALAGQAYAKPRSPS